MLKVLGLKIPKRKATKDKLVNLIISLFHIKLNYNDTSNLLLYPYVYVLVESSQMCVSSQSIPLNSAGSSEIVTEGNYILDFVARNSYLLDRQVSSLIFFLSPSVCHAQTCPIYVKPARAKCNLFLVGIMSFNQKSFYSLYKSLICRHTCPFMPV